MIKIIRKLGIEGKSPQNDKGYLGKPRANIIIKVKYWNFFSLRSRLKYGCLLSPDLFNIVLEVSAIEIKQEKEIKVTQIGKEEVKLSLFENEIGGKIFSTDNPKESTKNY